VLATQVVIIGYNRVVTAEQLAIALLTPVSTLAVVMVGFLYNNSRMSDLRSEIKDLLKAEIGRLDAKIDRNHSEMLTSFAGLDRRLSHIEAQLGIEQG
jgi:hypothetical protein